ncbi:MAG TPA: hypothetical protein RMH99_31750 [Sandaracinaceae bacterium LLY-WYZ-13_1]|nr:hypothetical protein [Sandaracinaceae bacterium LLY-WYZ-13_1]
MLASEPADGATGVPREADYRVFFDRPLHPRDLHRGHVRIESGTRPIFALPRFDPVQRVLHVEHGTLDPNVRYRLEIEGMRDLGRAEMAPVSIVFDTGEALGSSTPTPSPGWDDVAPVLRARCATDGCHGGEAPVLGLDLSSGAAVQRTAIDVAAAQTRVGIQEEAPWEGTETLAGLARIDVVASVGRPARSYLLYKVLGEPHAPGERMPPPPASALPAGELQLLSDWILAGAPTD